MTLEEYLEQALEGFKRDPADTRFQEGYKAALEDIQKFLSQQENKNWHTVIFFLTLDFEWYIRVNVTKIWWKVEKTAVKSEFLNTRTK